MNDHVRELTGLRAELADRVRLEFDLRCSGRVRSATSPLKCRNCRDLRMAIDRLRALDAAIQALAREAEADAVYARVMELVENPPPVPDWLREAVRRHKPPDPPTR